MIESTRKIILTTAALGVLALFPLSGSAESGKGIGPVKELKLSPLDEKLAEKGKGVFELKCAACHKIDEKYVGPALKGVTTRREPEWIMNMILNPQEMTQKDPTAKELFEQLLIQMTFQNVTEEEARSILEYFRKNDAAAK